MARFQTHKENIPPSSISFQLSNDYDEEDEDVNIQERIEEFKRENPEQLEELISFVDDVIKEATTKVAEKQQVIQSNIRFQDAEHLIEDLQIKYLQIVTQFHVIRMIEK